MAASDAIAQALKNVQMTKDVLQAFKDVQLPSVNDLVYQIQPYQTEEMIQNPLHLNIDDLKLADTTLKNVAASPEVLQAEQDVLNQLQTKAQEGLTAQERADLARTEAEQRSTVRGQREAMLQNLRERGVAGTGAEVAARLASQQEAANIAAQRGLDIEALSKQQALQALQGQGELASKMRQEQVGEQQKAATAQDIINQYNQQQQVGARQANISAEQKAAEQRQAIEQANAERATQQAALPGAAKTQVAQLELQKAGGEAGVASQQQQLEAQKEAQKKQQTSSLLSAGLAAGATLLSDIRVKDDVSPATELDVEEFLNGLTGRTYRYKGEDKTTGGIVAQDLEKTKMGEGMVGEDENGMKEIDLSRLLGGLAAATGDLNERLKNIESRRGAK